MLRFPSAMLRIGISGTGVTVLRTSGWLHRQVDVVGERPMTDAISSAANLAATLDNIFMTEKCEGLPATFILADDYTRFFMVTPPRNANQLQDCRAAAEMRFQSLYGESPGNWQLAADWNLRKPFLACAMSRVMRDVIMQVTAKHHLVLTELAPYFIASWNRWYGVLKPGAWFAAAHGHTLTFAAIERRNLCAVRSTSMPEDRRIEGQWLFDYLTREALRLNLAVPDRIQFCGDAVGHWASHSDGPLTLERLDAGERRPDHAAHEAGIMLALAGAQR